MDSVAFGFPTGTMTGIQGGSISPGNWVDSVAFVGDPNQLQDVILTTPAPSPNGTYLDLGNGNAFISPDAMGQMFDANGNAIRANNGAGTAPAIQAVTGLVSALGNLALGIFKALNPPKPAVIQGGTLLGGTTAQVTTPGQTLKPPVIGQGSGGGFLLIGAAIVVAVILLK